MDSVSFYDKVQQQIDLGLPLIVYRKPKEKVLQTFLQKDNVLYKTRDYKISGFVFAPFDHNKKAIFLPYKECDYFTCDANVNSNKIKSNGLNDVLLSSINQENDIKHKSLVNEGIAAIKNGFFRKVVLSRKEEIIFEKTLSPLLLFRKLQETYQDAFVYLWFHPETGVWVGATPETLLTSVDNEVFTMALAGTLPFKENMIPEWTEKEKDEQQIVTDYIVEQLSPISISINTSDAFTQRAGSIVHLRTDISVKLTDGIAVEQVLKRLHPTPAVCGLPTVPAKNFILSEEGYDRTYYTGFLGELNFQKQNVLTSDLYVNLRCMQLVGNKVVIYVGGGVTKDSNPEKEWKETVRKTDIMKKVLE